MMHRLAARAVIAGLVLVLHVTPGWGGPPNPTQSDAGFNTAGGTGALLENASGMGNTAFGHNALLINTTGSYNTAFGDNALVLNMTGMFNTANGDGALVFNISGDENTASGGLALYSNTSGRRNTATGLSALRENTTGSGNTALGYRALRYSTGAKNIAVGHEAGITLTSGNRNIYIGNPGAEIESRTMRLGNTQTRTFIAGIATAAISGAPVEIDTVTGQVGIATSSARYKRDIEPVAARSEGVFRLRPVTFVYAHDAQGVRQYGLVAEEVATVYPELVTRSATGEVQAVRYRELIPMLVNELQRQQREVAELRDLVGRLRGAGAAAER